MKINIAMTKTGTCLLAAALMTLGAATTAGAAAVTLQAQVLPRPLTPTEMTTYGLSSLQKSAGLSTIGVGEPAYLEVLVNIAVPRATITNVSWSLTAKPIGSLAALATSPLGTNVPTYKSADKTAFQVAGRILLRPDMVGQYTVVVTVGTTTSGTTNVTQVITAGTFAGIQTCTFCHSGGLSAPNKVVPWQSTLHATFFSRAIDGLESSHYSGSCISCHTVGYDANTNAVNGGFDDVAKQLGWVFPAVLTNGNWASMQTNYPSLANLANIQCENCHGPGSQHVFSNGILGNTNAISVNYAAGDCAQCHDSTPTHVKSAEWNVSLHANTTRTPSGPGREACVRCHTAGGFIGYVKNLGSSNTYATNTVFEALTCQTCHEPHDATNPHQLRTGLNYTLPDGTAVTNAGFGGFCMNCHHSRNGSATNNIAKYPSGQNTWPGGSSFGVHDSPQGDMLEGVNAITYGKAIPSSAHRNSITNTCAGCHMQPVAATDPAFLQAGGHTFHMTYNVVTGGVTNTLDKVDVCVQCHGPISSFDMAKVDYNGDGVIEGVQTEVQHLLDKLTTMLPSSTYRADGQYFADGLVKSPSVKTNWQTKYLNAAYNWQFVNNDGSKGVHNAQYAVGLLKASMADLTGDANTDSLADSWQIQYFGSVSNPNAAPNATPAGDGIPNWLKYALGINPLVPGIVVPGGVVWANGTALAGNTPTNTVQIYTAAEVTFNTDLGKTYQIQEVTSLSGGWQNVGPTIAGTGASVSYLTSTRKNLQQYFRVAHTP